MSKSKMTNQEFIARLKIAKLNLSDYHKSSIFQLLDACIDAGICWGKFNSIAIFADGKFSSLEYFNNLPENRRRDAAIAIIDASVKALK